MPDPSIVALIPARAGSKRVPGKNTRLLGGHPLLAWSIATARESGIFDLIFVSTDSEEIAETARSYGASVPCLRPEEFATDTSPDIGWVAHTLKHTHPHHGDVVSGMSLNYDAFAILRPTSPFRTAETIQRAWSAFRGARSGGIDSLRAVEKCSQHPYKMWRMTDWNRMEPVFKAAPGHHPWHSSQYGALPEIYVQNASLEIAWTKVVFDTASIAGENVMPFFTEGYEGFDINLPHEFERAERLVEEGKVALPSLLADVKPETEMVGAFGWH
jgi:CMP-N,N'-diacetyllegionaminic acid synthase